MDITRAFSNLERIGIGDLKNFVEKPDTKPFNCDAYGALKDFIRFGFYRNRREEIAEMYIEFAREALETISRNTDNPTNCVKFLCGKGGELSAEFERIATKRHKRTHGTDRKFLQSVCDEFVPTLQDFGFNIRTFCAHYFKTHDLKTLHSKLDDVRGVGPKIASLYLRDMMMLYSKSFDKAYLRNLETDQILAAYPIDTWVEQLSKKLLGVEGTKEEIANIIIEKCESLGVSPVFVNHGLWYIGANAQDFLLANLDRLHEFEVPSTM